MKREQLAAIQLALNENEYPEQSSLAELDDADRVIKVATATPVGRRWLRSLTDMGPDLAALLLTFDDDFRSTRRDSTLSRVVAVARPTVLAEHRFALAAGTAAATLWSRLADDRDALIQTALDVIAGNDPAAAESTLYLLVMDPLDPYGLGPELRSRLAETALRGGPPSARTLAAEYLFDHDLPILADQAPELVLDEDERIRGLAWSAGFQMTPRETMDQATNILASESESLPARRSALAALGTHLPTSEVVDILSFFVGHPDEELALDAGNLLYRLHRYPTIAMAAAQSPHESVREIGAYLLDPYRGSPAAGGSRPGDPTGSDIFAEMIRQTEERMFPEDLDDDKS